MKFILFVILICLSKAEDKLKLELDKLIKKESKLCNPSDPEKLQLMNSYVKSNKNLTEEEISLIKFAAGDCLPVVIVTGLYTTKLQLHITNCEELRKYHPKMAKECGFDKKCENGYERIFWLSEKFETVEDNICFSQIASINFVNKDGSLVEEKTKGYRLTFYGNTPKTNGKLKCGFGASCNIFDKFFYFGRKVSKGALFMRKHFQSLGYQIGINLFSVPVDWRRTPNDPYNQGLVKDAVELAYKITGKPVVIISHSYGCLLTMEYLYTLPIELKNTIIARSVLIAPSFMGANKTLKPLILGNDEFNNVVKLIISLYISMENQKVFQNGCPSLLQLLPKSFWNANKDENWMEVILARARVENKITKCVRELVPQGFKSLKENTMERLEASPHENGLILDSCIYPIIKESKNELLDFKTLLPFFPDLEYGCGVDTLSDSTCLYKHTCKLTVWDKYCRLNFFIPFDEDVLEVNENGKQSGYNLLTYDNIKTLIKNYGIGEFDMKYYDFIISTMSKHLDTLDHPGVPVTIYYRNTAQTPVQIKLNENPKRLTELNKYVERELGFGIYRFYGGDGTVPAASLLFPALKWAASEESLKNPVHFVEYCSNGKYKQQNIDLKDNQYINLSCECKNNMDRDCLHSGMISDDNLLEHLNNFILGDVNKLHSKEEFLKSLDVGKGITMNCANLKKLIE
jgi:hypothetical protein